MAYKGKPPSSSVQKEMREVYVTTDGENFNDSETAEAHQAELDEKLFFFNIWGSPDTTEKGTMRFLGYAKVMGSEFNASLYLQDALYKKFGSRTAYVQGVSPCEAWAFAKLTKDEAIETRKKNTCILDVKYQDFKWLGEYAK